MLQPMPSRAAALLTRQGLLFDLAVFVANLFAVGPLTALVRRSEGMHPLFSALLVAAFVAQGLGAWLKRRPLQARWAAQGRPAAASGALVLFYLLVMVHYCLFAALLILAQVGLGLWPEEPAWVRTAASLLTLGLAVVPTALVLRAVQPGQPRRRAAEAALPDPVVPDRREGSAGPWGQELLADLALYFSVVVIMAWWEGVFVETLAGAGAQSLALKLLLVVLVTVPFAVFYLPPRLLLLVEDYRTGWSWLTIAAAMLPLAARIILG